MFMRKNGENTIIGLKWELRQEQSRKISGLSNYIPVLLLHDKEMKKSDDKDDWLCRHAEFENTYRIIKRRYLGEYVRESNVGQDS